MVQQPNVEVSLPWERIPAFGANGQWQSARLFGYLDLPCSMLVRELGALCLTSWSVEERALVSRLPKGSTAVVEGTDAPEVGALLQGSGPKILQVFASALDAWRHGTGARNPDTSYEATLEELAMPLATGQRRSALRREAMLVNRIISALARVGFVGGPESRKPAASEPGSPIVIHQQLSDGTVTFSPGPQWVRELFGPSPRVAKIPKVLLSLHARNDRYAILLGWYLAIMLRVNRKYGFTYRVRLQNMLEGAGISVPDRNVSRFLAAVYRGIRCAPGILASGPPHLLYASEELLSTMFTFRPDPTLLMAYGVLQSDSHNVCACNFENRSSAARR